METINLSTPTPQLRLRPSREAPIIIATDGSDQSQSALVVGRLLAQRSDAMRLITVLKSMPVVSEAQLPLSPDIEASLRAASLRDVRELAARTWPPDNVVETELFDGDPAALVARVAHDARATMIVCGLGRHRVADRAFGDETALRLIRLSDVPVFAAANAVHDAPRRIVVAADFSETSLRAARLALDIAAPSATMYLAHVIPRDRALNDWMAWRAAYKEDAGVALERTRELLHIPADVTVQHVLLQGDPATELLAFATNVDADLIVTGSHGRGFVARMLIGSVTTRIVRCSSCSVLTVPHAMAMLRARTAIGPSQVVTIPNAEWAASLDDFTQRNHGRRGILEVDDPELGAQAQEFDYPLMGATFDTHDQRVDLMFGETGSASPHLARSISGASSIDLLRDDRGQDLAMRIVHGSGQTLLTFAGAPERSSAGHVSDT